MAYESLFRLCVESTLDEAIQVNQWLPHRTITFALQGLIDVSF